MLISYKDCQDEISNDELSGLISTLRQLGYNQHITKVLTPNIPDLTQACYLILDKENSKLLILDENGSVYREAGSRFGLYNAVQENRIGFEYPEDIALIDSEVLISDSGNQRICWLDLQFKEFRSIELPVHPFKILFTSRDLLILSDFDNSLLFVSPQYGFIGSLRLEFFADFYRVSNDSGRMVIGTETGGCREVILNTTDIEQIAQYCKNDLILLEIALSENKIETAFTIAGRNSDLIPHYYRETEDKRFESAFEHFVSELFGKLSSEFQEAINRIRLASMQYLQVYSVLNSRGDQEAGNIIKEKQIFEIFNEIKGIRNRTRRLRKWTETLSASNPINLKMKKRLDGFLKKAAVRLSELSMNMGSFDQLSDDDILDFVVEFWMHSDLLKQFKYSESKLPGWPLKEMFLNQILKDFYFSISLFYYAKNQLIDFSRFAEKELACNPDKVELLFKYADMLIAKHHYDLALAALKKSSDQNREKINEAYFRIYKAKGAYSEAIEFLKKEITLFPHKIELIPELAILSRQVDASIDIHQYISRVDSLNKGSIDHDYYIALSHYYVGELNESEYFLEKELERYPENHQAIKLYLKIILHKIDREIDLKDAELTWGIFLRYIYAGVSERAQKSVLPFFRLLNVLPNSAQLNQTLGELSTRNVISDYSDEILIYQRFRQLTFDHTAQAEFQKTFEEALGSNSCSSLALKFLISRLQDASKTNPVADYFSLIELALKYNPGNTELISFIN